MDCLRCIFVREASNRNGLVGFYALALCTFPSTQQHEAFWYVFWSCRAEVLVASGRRAILRCEQPLSTLPHVNISIQSDANSLNFMAGKPLPCFATAGLRVTDLGFGLRDLLLGPHRNNPYL